MNSALVGEGHLADEGVILWEIQVADGVNEPREMGEVGESIAIDGQLLFHLQQEVRDDVGEVGIAAAFSQSVEGTLDMARAFIHRGQGVGICHSPIVVGVDADLGIAGLLPGAPRNFLDLGWQASSVGVA